MYIYINMYIKCICVHIYSGIFCMSFWQLVWPSIWNSFCHVIWHIFSHFIIDDVAFPAFVSGTGLLRDILCDMLSGIYSDILTQISRRGENRASVLSVFPKNVVFAIAKLLMLSSNLSEFSRGKSGGFDLFSCNLQGILSWKSSEFLFHLTSPCASATCGNGSKLGYQMTHRNGYI